MEANRQAKIKNILKILSGEIKASDLLPKDLLIRIGYGKEISYFIENKDVNKDNFAKYSIGINKMTIKYGKK